MYEEFNPVKPQWWCVHDDLDRDDPQVKQARARDLFDMVRSLEEQQRAAHEQNLWNARVYSNRELVHFDWGHNVFYNPSLTPISLLGENLVLSVVETMVSRVNKNRVKVTPVPRGASFKLRRLCRRLDKWVYGEFVRNRVYEKVTQVFRDACVFGFGALRVDHRDGRLVIRRVFPDDLVIDQTEVAADPDGKPSHVYERRCRRIEEVEAEYNLAPGTLKATRGTYLDYRAPGRGWVVVVEGYRLGPGGRHFVAAEDVQILDEPWEESWSPYVWYHYERPLSGFYWPSVVERTLPFQIRLNEINEVIRDAQDLMARPRILVAEGSRVAPADIDNLTGRIIKYAGIKPEALVWDAVSPELYNERERQIKACYEQFGLAPLAAQGKLPNAARLDSSAALQEAVAIGDDRQADAISRLEQFHLDLADLMVRTMKVRGGDYETTWFTGGRKARAETIRWSEIDLDRDAYVLTLEVASLFSMTPAARRDKLERWFEAGLISQDQLWEYDANPDLENEQSIRRAAADDIARVIELLEDGKYESPTMAQDLVNGVKRVALAYLNLGNYEGVPAEVKVNFLKWVSMARAVLAQGADGQTTPTAPGALQPPVGGPTAGGPAGAQAMVPQVPVPGMLPGGPAGMMPPPQTSGVPGMMPQPPMV